MSEKAKDIKPISCKLDECKKIQTYIEAKGGSISEAIRALDLNIHSKTFRTYAKRVGFEYKRYRHAYKRYGHWMLLPCTAERFSTADFIHQALCTKCSRVFDVSINNLRAAASNCCIECSSKTEKKRLQVKCEQTGEIYGSLRSLCRKLGLLGQYKRIRLRLMKNGKLELNNRIFKPVWH